MIPNLQDNTKSKVLSMLKSNAGSTVQDLAEAMNISVPAARKHLCDLEGAGLIVSSVEKPCGRGRPQHVFRLSCKGEGAFPKNYANLCLDMIEHLEHLFGEGALLKIMDAREEKLFAAWSPLLQNAATLEQKLALLAELLSEAGYQAKVRCCERGTLFLEQGNCPNLDVARTHKQLCGSEQVLYQRLLGVTVVRETQISSGASSCRYRIG